MADWAAGLSAESAGPYFTFPAPATYLKFKLKQQHGNSRSPGYMNFRFMIDIYYYWIVVNYDIADV